MFLVFTRMPGESYRRRSGSLLLCSRDVVPGMIDSLRLNTEIKNKMHVALTSLSVEFSLDSLLLVQFFLFYLESAPVCLR